MEILKHLLEFTESEWITDGTDFSCLCQVMSRRLSFSNCNIFLRLKLERLSSVVNQTCQDVSPVVKTPA